MAKCKTPQLFGVRGAVLVEAGSSRLYRREYVHGEKHHQDMEKFYHLNNKKLQNCVKAVENGLISDTITNHINEYEKQLTRLKDDAARIKLLDGDVELDQQHIEFFFWSIAQKIKTADKYKSILLSSIVRSVIVYKDYIEIQYNYKNELPILQNPVRIESSYLNQLVNLPIPHTNLAVLVSQDFFTVRIRREEVA